MAGIGAGGGACPHAIVMEAFRASSVPSHSPGQAAHVREKLSEMLNFCFDQLNLLLFFG